VRKTALAWDESTLRYFFDAYDGKRLVPDVDGIELPNLAAAHAEA